MIDRQIGRQLQLQLPLQLQQPLPLPYSWTQWTWTATGLPTVKWERGRQGGRATQYARNKVMYITTRTRYVENANEHVRKNEMPNSEKRHHCNNKWHGGFSWEKIATVAHSPFCPKDCSCQLGKVLDRTRYPTGVCKGISVGLIGYMLPIQTRAFLC